MQIYAPCRSPNGGSVSEGSRMGCEIAFVVVAEVVLAAVVVVVVVVVVVIVVVVVEVVVVVVCSIVATGGGLIILSSSELFLPHPAKGRQRRLARAALSNLLSIINSYSLKRCILTEKQEYVPLPILLFTVCLYGTGIELLYNI